MILITKTSDQRCVCVCVFFINICCAFEFQYIYLFAYFSVFAFVFRGGQTESETHTMLNGFGTVVNALGLRAKSYLPQISGTVKASYPITIGGGGEA